MTYEIPKSVTKRATARERKEGRTVTSGQKAIVKDPEHYDPLGILDLVDCIAAEAGKRLATRKPPAPRKPSKLHTANGYKGRESYEITPQLLERVRDLAKLNLSGRSIAGSLGWPSSTFHAKCKQDKRLQLAVEQGRAQGVEEVAKGLYSNATDEKSVPAQSLYLKAADKWADKTEIEHTGTVEHTHTWVMEVVEAGQDGEPNRITETITLSPSEYEAVDEAEKPSEAAAQQDKGSEPWR